MNIKYLNYKMKNVKQRKVITEKKVSGFSKIKIFPNSLVH